MGFDEQRRRYHHRIGFGCGPISDRFNTRLRGRSVAGCNMMVGYCVLFMSCVARGQTNN